jgi:hypothetical protein
MRDVIAATGRFWPVHIDMLMLTSKQRTSLSNAFYALYYSAAPTQLSLENANGSLHPPKRMSNNKLPQLVPQTWVK